MRFVRFHGMRSRQSLFPAEPKIESFLTDLSVHGNIAAALWLVNGTAQVDPRDGVTRRHHVDPSVITNAITVAVRRAGLTKTIRAHPVCHTFATHLRPCSTDIRTIQHLLGHHAVATTRRDTPILQQGGQGVPSPLDDLGVSFLSA